MTITDADLILTRHEIDEWLALTAVREVWTNEEIRDRLLDLRNTLPVAQPAEVTA